MKASEEKIDLVSIKSGEDNVGSNVDYAFARGLTGVREKKKEDVSNIQ